jgi:flagellar protein FlaI
LQDGSSVNKSSCLLKRKDVGELENKVDKILFEKKKRKSLEAKGSANQKKQSSIYDKLKHLDIDSFSPEAKHKKPVYFVKVKKEYDGEKKKTVTRKKLKKIFRKNEKPTEKVGLSDEHHPQKTVGKSAAQIPQDTAKWLDEQTNKISKEKNNVSDSTSTDNKPFQKSPLDPKIEREKTTPAKPSSSKSKQPVQDGVISLKKNVDKIPRENNKDGNAEGQKDTKHPHVGKEDKEKRTVPVESNVESTEPLLIYTTTDKSSLKDASKSFRTGNETIENKVESKSKKQEDIDKTCSAEKIVKKKKIKEDVVSKTEQNDLEDLLSKDTETADLPHTNKTESTENHLGKNFEESKKDTTDNYPSDDTDVKKSDKKEVKPEDKKKEPLKNTIEDKQDISEISINDLWQEETGIEESKPAYPEKTEEIDKDDTYKEDQVKKKPPSPVTKIEIEGITPDGEIRFLDEANQLKSVTLQRLGYPEESWEELDFYPLEEPFAYIEIIREKETFDKRYVLVEVELSKDEAHILKFLKETLSGLSVDTIELESKGEESYLIKRMDQIIDDYALKIDALSKKKIVYFLKKQFLGLDRLEVLMKDPNIEDISCDGSSTPLFVYHRRFGSSKSNVQFDNEDELSDFVVKLAQKCGKHISISEPMLDATMPDGSRLQTTLSTEITTKGSTFTIRKFKEDPFSPPDLIEFNTMSAEMVAYLWLAVENGISALVAGGTAAGKTSTLNAFSLFIPKEAKIVSIEETREINLPHRNWIPGVSRSGFGEVIGGKVVGEIDIYDLMKAALRQRPEYILVGEIRGREAYVLFQAMATGHTTYSTVHADSAASLIHRLEGKPINIPRIMLQALDIVCIQVISRIKNKRARRCKQIIEIIDIDPTTKEILTNEVFRWDPVEDTFIYNGKSYILERIRADKDLSRDGMTQEIKRRSRLLDWMNKNNVREFKKVSTLIARYVENPAQLMEKIQDG